MQMRFLVKFFEIACTRIPQQYFASLICLLVVWFGLIFLLNRTPALSPPPSAYLCHYQNKYQNATERQTEAETIAKVTFQ